MDNLEVYQPLTDEELNEYLRLTSDDGKLKVRATRAAHERNANELTILVKIFLERSRSREVSDLTIKAYDQAIRLLLTAWKEINLLKPGDHAGELFRYWLRKVPYGVKRQNGKDIKLYRSVATINKILAGAKTLYKALRWAGATDADPFKDITQLEDPIPRTEKVKPYTVDELRSILECASDPCDVVMILLASHAGLRIHEVAKLEWADVDLAASKLTVKGKGGYEASVHLSPELRSVLMNFRSQSDSYTRRKARALKILPFGAYRARERFEGLCALAGVTYKGRAFHALRHTAGTRMYEKTLDLKAVMKHLRQKHPTTASIYAMIHDDTTRTVVQDWQDLPSETKEPEEASSKRVDTLYEQLKDLDPAQRRKLAALLKES